ncbi:MAG: glycosyltransferase [Planctomycetota bacterium]|jgi:hypothetical protein
MKLTVAVPVWNNKDVAWLCMESLRRQRGVDFDWELIIFEEQHDQQLGELYFFNNGPSVKTTYITREEKLSLGRKWYALINAAHPDSEGMVFCDADDYCHPYVLRDTRDAFLAGHDWFSHTNGYFYDFNTKKIIQYSSRKRPGIRLSARMDIAKKLPDRTKPRLIHAWFQAHMKPQNILYSNNNHWEEGLFTHGHNSISNRDKYFERPRSPYRSTEKCLEDIVPPDVATRIKAIETNDT